MAYGIVHGNSRHMTDTVEVVHTVLVSDVFLTTKNIDNWGMNFFQFFLGRHGHTANGPTCILHLEKAAVANHQQRDTRIGTVEQRLQSAARHTCHTEVLHIYLLIIGRLRVCILRINPVDALNLLLRLRHGTTVGLLIHGDKARSQYQIAMRGNLIQEFVVLPRRVCTGAVTPYQYGQRIRGIERRKVLRHKYGVLWQVFHFGHHGLIRTCATFFDDTRFQRGLCCGMHRANTIQHGDECENNATVFHF